MLLFIALILIVGSLSGYPKIKKASKILSVGFVVFVISIFSFAYNCDNQILQSDYCKANDLKFLIISSLTLSLISILIYILILYKKNLLK